MTKQKIVWEKLPNKYNLFTKRNTVMIDMVNNEIIQHYSNNVKIAVVEQAIHNGDLYFRTASASEKGLDWAFKASAFNLPNGVAPSVHSVPPVSKTKPVKPHTSTGIKKQKGIQNKAKSKGGETKPRKNFLARLFRRENG